MSSLITRLDLEDRLTSSNVRRYAVQCSLATFVVLVLLITLDAVTQTVLIAALGATTFIAFAVPRSKVSSARCLIGGYLVGMLAGTLMSSINSSIGISDLVMSHAGLIVFGALATGIAMFLMVITKTEHPPAAALAMGLVLNEWSGLTLCVIVGGVILLCVCKRLVLPHLMDLV
ncbi:MAG: HPP family protein [Woeseiaceae bacterium]|nr:HPP family protein [Woeseiaceae bacterium]